MRFRWYSSHYCLKIHTGIISQTYHYTEIKGIYVCNSNPTKLTRVFTIYQALNSQCFINLFKTFTINEIQSKPNTKIQTNIFDDKRYHPCIRKDKTKQNTIIKKTTTEKIHALYQYASGVYSYLVLNMHLFQFFNES